MGTKHKHYDVIVAWAAGEALELSAFYMHKITTARGKADYSVVRAALAALKALESEGIGRGME